MKDIVEEAKSLPVFGVWVSHEEQMGGPNPESEETFVTLSRV